jgi:hypothetical protein
MHQSNKTSFTKPYWKFPNSFAVVLTLLITGLYDMSLYTPIYIMKGTEWGFVRVGVYVFNGHVGGRC